MNIDRNAAHLLKRILSERFITLAASLALLCAVALLAPPLVADPAAAKPPAAVTPLDKEQDLQSKLRLQEKIARELLENRQKILKYSSGKASEKGTTSTDEHSSESSRGVPRDDR
ncbi:hypothetical protein [Pseudomonas turukhanskensis]|uniref:Uncharacterized protein n=1 Tax=Pseudomonas turukhanskensis TaxID=1806536 RepID=A0A9W6K523_9PSED|nr:hypothetical protein [Pseudomonas turukhanskensis]GLK89611.1 hypothetical protein GCM10017655_26730 [Pseudomonas turukhanskensis]